MSQQQQTGTKIRRDAWALLTRYTKNKNLQKHALAVEAAMRHYARHFGENEDEWGMVGLLHDFDWEIHPTLEEHPIKGQAILEQEGFPRHIRRAIMAHAPHTGTARTSLMEKAIFAVDELTGFIVAVALVRPAKKLEDVDVAAVKKKMKEKSFAAAVNREDIQKGAEELGLPLDEHIHHVLTAMQESSDALGL